MTVKNNKRTVFGWAMYDWANSAYSTTTVGALMPAYFAAIVVGEDGWNFGGTNYLADEIWGYATGIVIFIFFLIMPVFGAMADMSGSKMKFLRIFAYVLPLTAISNSIGRQWLMYINKDLFYAISQLVASLIAFTLFLILVQTYGIFAMPISLIAYEAISILIMSSFLVKNFND